MQNSPVTTTKFLSLNELKKYCSKNVKNKRVLKECLSPVVFLRGSENLNLTTGFYDKTVKEIVEVLKEVN